jgi:Na+-translocating ferredoxin:NAD+ oxidoreductase RnfG subunit
MKTFLIIIFCVSAAILFAESKVELIKPQMIQDAMGDSVKMKFNASPLPHMMVFERKNPSKAAGYLFNSGDIKVSGKGHEGGDVDAYVLLAPDGSVISVMLGDNKETSGGVQKVFDSGLLKDWKGKKHGEPPPDTVTGATLTSKALNQSVSALMDKLAELKFFANIP